MRIIVNHLILITSFLFFPPAIQAEVQSLDTAERSAGIVEEIDSKTVEIERDTSAQLDNEPKLTAFVKAVYPDSLAKSGIEGTVTLELLINEKGTIDSVKVTKSLHPVLDTCAIAAAKQFVFSPAIADSVAVPVYLTYDYHFTLDEIITEIDEYVNITGRVIEKGTRKPVMDADISLTIGDTAATAVDTIQTVTAGTTRIPLDRYLEKIGSFAGQTLENRKLLTTTDSTGRFSFRSIPKGKIYLKIAATGFDLYENELEIHDSEKIDNTVYMDRVAIDQYEITVYGKAESKEVIQRTLDVREAKRIPGFSGDAVKAVQALPGVARPVFGSTEIILRGADWNDNKYYIDGVEIPYLWHDMGNNSVINSNLIDKVDLFSGGFSAKYGDALGGVINVDTRKTKQDSWHMIADMNISYSSLVLDIPLSDKLSLTGSMRREYYISVMSWVLSKFTDIDVNFDMYYWDYSLRLNYSPSKNHTIFCEFMNVKDIFKMWSIDNSEDDDDSRMDYSNGFKLGVAGWDWKISDSWVNSLRYGLSPISTKFDMGSDNTDLKGKLSGYEHTVRDELKWKATDRVQATLGLDLHLEPTDLNYSYSGAYSTIKNLEEHDTVITVSENIVNGSVGGYLSLTLKPIDKLTVTPEYRMDYYPGLNYHGSMIPEFWKYSSKPEFRWSCEPSFRLSSRYSLSKDHALKGSAGTYNKSPGFEAISEPWGNPSLEPARGAHYTLGYEWQITDLISLDMSGYINRQWNKSHYVNAIERGEQYEDGTYVNRGKGRMKGVELFLRHNKTNRFSGWLSYSLAYSERYDYSENKWIQFDRNILNNLQIVTSLNCRKNINLGLRLQYTDGYPYTPAEKVLYYDASEFKYVPQWGETNSKRHTPFVGLDFRFEKKVAFKRSIMTFYIGCDRILHFLQFIEKDNGEPLYLPAEFPTYNYDYSEFEGMANFPGVSFGLSFEL